jgi:deoxyribodipyrimidine photo-lyase
VLDDAILARRDTGGARVRFMLGCLQALAEALAAKGSRLIVVRGDPAQELVRVARASGATTVHWNKDYEPYARGRDTRVSEALAAAGIRAQAWKDQVLFEESEILTQQRRPFTVFTPYARVWRTQKPAAPGGMPRLPPLPEILDLPTVPLPDAAALGFTSDATLPPPGEAAAHARLRHFAKHDLAGYAERRDSRTAPAPPASRLLSASARSRSVRSTRRPPAAAPAPVSSPPRLAWRDFYQQILFHHPNVERQAFKPSMRALAWENDRGLFAAWQRGETGYPIVDAAMRQLRATGWMHNRCRMIVASFLTKDLLIDWRWGERHFMRELVDGDLAANNGGWQWAASTGTDAQPWFRIQPDLTGERSILTGPTCDAGSRAAQVPPAGSSGPGLPPRGHRPACPADLPARSSSTRSAGLALAMYGATRDSAIWRYSVPEQKSY